MKLTDSGLLTLTKSGIYCPAADVYIDPWRPVERAIITHGHSDHAGPGMKQYLCVNRSASILRHRLGSGISLKSLAYGEPLFVDGVKITLHPAGHILGSAQVRVERQGEIAVVTGDYKTAPDPTCDPFELIRCHTFITESTFGLPIYRWPSESQLATQINSWWRQNQAAGLCSIMFGYALGKSQRALAMLDPSIGPIFAHGAVEPMNTLYREEGIVLPNAKSVVKDFVKADASQCIVLAPPSAAGTRWMTRFGDIGTAYLSGWMSIRGTRRRQAVDRGFVVSDHVDWPSLMSTIRATGAERIWVTHGYTSVVARHLCELGLDGRVLSTEWEGETIPNKTESQSKQEFEPEDQPTLSRDDSLSEEE